MENRYSKWQHRIFDDPDKTVSNLLFSENRFKKCYSTLFDLSSTDELIEKLIRFYFDSRSP